MVMRRYPGSYTLSSLLAEDIDALMYHLALLDPDIGKAADDGE